VAWNTRNYRYVGDVSQVESGIYSASFDTDIDIQDEYFTQVRQLNKIEKLITSQT
jgi:hypothetical protein